MESKIRWRFPSHRSGRRPPWPQDCLEGRAGHRYGRCGCRRICACTCHRLPRGCARGYGAPGFQKALDVVAVDRQPSVEPELMADRLEPPEVAEVDVPFPGYTAPRDPSRECQGSNALDRPVRAGEIYPRATLTRDVTLPYSDPGLRRRTRFPGRRRRRGRLGRADRTPAPRCLRSTARRRRHLD